MTAKLNIAQRISAVMAEVDYIQKEKKEGMQYRIVSHDAVTAKVRPILHKNGIVYYPKDMVVEQVGNRTQAMFNVRFENIEDRADFIDVATFGYGVDGQDKGPGKAMSYGVKYALLKVLGLETGDDPDTVQDESANFVAEPMIDQTQRGIVIDLAKAADVNILTIVESYGAKSIDGLTAKQAAAVIKRLNLTIDKKTEQKEAA